MPLDLYVDIHSHILPGIDDGAKDNVMFEDMLQTAENSGVGCIIATPHYIWRSYDNTLDRVQKCMDELCNNVSLEEVAEADERTGKNAGVRLERKFKKMIKGMPLYTGAEIFIDPYVPEKLRSGIIPTLAGTSFVLVELPAAFLLPHAEDFFYDLQLYGFKPVLAHPERYSYLFDTEKYIDELINKGVFFQINSSSIIGMNGKTLQNAALKLIKNGFCHYVASDSHSSGNRNFHTMKKAFEFLCSTYEQDDISRFFCLNGSLLLNNREPEFVLPRKKKKFFSLPFFR